MAGDPGGFKYMSNAQLQYLLSQLDDDVQISTNLVGNLNFYLWEEPDKGKDPMLEYLGFIDFLEEEVYPDET